jgi:hypothetical protein
VTGRQCQRTEAPIDGCVSITPGRRALLSQSWRSTSSCTVQRAYQQTSSSTRFRHKTPGAGKSSSTGLVSEINCQALSMAIKAPGKGRLFSASALKTGYSISASIPCPNPHHAADPQRTSQSYGHTSGTVPALALALHFVQTQTASDHFRIADHPPRTLAIAQQAQISPSNLA